jgi:CRISPR-associated protein Csx16
MTTYFVSRHPGAFQWAKRKRISFDRALLHLNPDKLRPGDVVIGMLPVHLAAQVCARQARYFHLAMDVPYECRGMELSMDDMSLFSARIAEYRVESIP